MKNEELIMKNEIQFQGSGSAFACRLQLAA
jgi:hypothetical protein